MSLSRLRCAVVLHSERYSVHPQTRWPREAETTTSRARRSSALLCLSDVFRYCGCDLSRSKHFVLHEPNNSSEQILKHQQRSSAEKARPKFHCCAKSQIEFWTHHLLCFCQSVNRQKRKQTTYESKCKNFHLESKIKFARAARLLQQCVLVNRTYTEYATISGNTHGREQHIDRTRVCDSNEKYNEDLSARNVGCKRAILTECIAHNANCSRTDGKCKRDENKSFAFEIVAIAREPATRCVGYIFHLVCLALPAQRRHNASSRHCTCRYRAEEKYFRWKLILTKWHVDDTFASSFKHSIFDDFCDWFEPGSVLGFRSRNATSFQKQHVWNSSKTPAKANKFLPKPPNSVYSKPQKRNIFASNRPSTAIRACCEVALKITFRSWAVTRNGLHIRNVALLLPDVRVIFLRNFYAEIKSWWRSSCACQNLMEVNHSLDMHTDLPTIQNTYFISRAPDNFEENKSRHKKNSGNVQSEDAAMKLRPSFVCIMHPTRRLTLKLNFRFS